MAKNPFRYLTDREKNAVLRFKEKVLQIEPEAKLILYGSKARGDHHSESDIDILVVVPNLNWEKRRRILKIASKESIKSTVLLGVVVKSIKEFNSGLFRSSLYYMNLKKEGIYF